MSIAVRISDDLIKEAKTLSKIENRSISDQIEYWVRIGKIAEQNPTISFELIKEILIGSGELDKKYGSEYMFS